MFSSPLLLISSGKLTLLIPAARLFAGVDAPWPDKEGCTSYYSEREFHMKMLNRVNLATRGVLFCRRDLSAGGSGSAGASSAN